MVNDASSDNDHTPPPPTDSASPETYGQAPQAQAGDLTHELAQLLAASIAQNQANRARGGAPTNAELTSLANLVSVASAQRTLAPVFRDGLSALSYTQPKPAPSREIPAAASLEPEHDDEPMPIPSTWRQPAAQDDERWFRQQMGAALVGLIAGLMIVVPTVLWLSGWFEPQKTKLAAGSRAGATSSAPSSEAKAPAEPKASEVRTVKVQVRPLEKPAEGAAQYVTGSVDTPRAMQAQRPAQPPAAAPAPTVAAARLVEPNLRIEELLAQTTRRVESGDVAGAREALAGADDGAHGPVTFALAETYDPNMLAAWGSRGVAADVAKARALYRKAVSLGVTRAQTRLDALK